MKTSRIGGFLLGILLCAGPAWAAEQDEGAVVGEILQVLKQRGIVDEAEYQRMAAKNAAYEKQNEGFAPKIEWSGDFRFRHESFFYSRDDTGSDRNDRFRIRYRLRLNGKINVNEYADVLFRLASGDQDPRSTNQTLGGNGPDFDTDDIRLDRAFARLRAPEGWVGANSSAVLELGKVPNPFTWDIGPDFMLWDHDINPEGLSILYTHDFSDSTQAFANAGYYIIKENSVNSDPHMWGLQGGLHHDLGEGITLGGRVSYYQFNSVDNAFLQRGASGAGGVTDGGGNVVDGLAGGDSGSIGVIHLTGYTSYDGIENWPMMVYGEWAKNLDAVSSALADTGADDTAWAAGFEIGDKKKWVSLGFGYYHIEANAFPSQYIDSDLFDGRTNREGPAIYAKRTLMKNTDLNLTVFVSDVIDPDIEPSSDSVKNSDRVRIQTDVVFKF